jgi:RNA polymerase sigma-70 factor (sigma-E family)
MALQVDVGRHHGADFDDFYNDNRTSALRLATLLTQDRSSAEDVVQDAFSKILTRWERIEDPKAYLRTLVVNGVRSRHRRASRERDRLAHLGPCGSTAMHADEISDALASLSERERAVIVLFFYADLREREVAETLFCPVGTVKSLKSRALARLRKAIEQ